MAENALTVYQNGENSLRTGKFPEALRSYLQVVRAAPDFWRARFRIADCLLNFKARDAALEIYRTVARQAMKNGQPLEALVAIKMAALLNPKEHEAIEILAGLYSRDSDRVGPMDGAPSRRVLKPADAAPDLGALDGQELLNTAAKDAISTAGIPNYNGKLPPIPLFSFLDEDAFVRVLASLQLRRYVKDNAVIQEGQPGDSFFILAEGNVEVSRKVGEKKVSLARLHPGSVFGEMALISKAPRTATVTALEDCDLLELKRASLEDQAHQLESVTKALKEFTDERFLANLTATSAVFKPFPRPIRAEIVKKFRDFPVDPGDELISEGEAGQGLFLIIKGSVEVSKKDGASSKVSLATLKEGDVFGEISLLNDSPTTASCTAVTRGELLFLPKKEFTSTMARHPELKTELAKITAERIQKTKDAMDPEQYITIEDDDLIML